MKLHSDQSKAFMSNCLSLSCLLRLLSSWLEICFSGVNAWCCRESQSVLCSPFDLFELHIAKKCCLSLKGVIVNLLRLFSQGLLIIIFAACPVELEISIISGRLNKLCLLALYTDRLGPTTSSLCVHRKLIDWLIDDCNSDSEFNFAGV